MFNKTKEYYYEQINDKENKKINIIKETTTPRDKKDVTYTIIKTVKKTYAPKGIDDDCICGHDYKEFSSNKYSKNYSSYSNISNKKQTKYSSADYKNNVSNKNNKCICGKMRCTCGDVAQEKKYRGRSVETRNINTSCIKKCTCGKDGKNCICGRGSQVYSREKNEVKTSIQSSGKICTCGKLYCTCGLDHSKVNITQSTNIKKSNDKKCIYIDSK